MKLINFFCCLVLLFFAVNAFSQQPSGSSSSILGFQFDTFFILLIVFVLLWLALSSFVVFEVFSSKNKILWKGLWIVSVLFLNLWGVFLYFLLGSKKRISMLLPDSVKSLKGPMTSVGEPKVGIFSSNPYSEKPASSSAKFVPSSFSSAPTYMTGSSYFSKSQVSPVEQKQVPVSPVSSPVRTSYTPSGKSDFKERAQALANSLNEPDDFMPLTDEEKSEAAQLVRLILPEKQKYTRDDVLSVVLEKGYSLNVARKVVNDLFK